MDLGTPSNILDGDNYKGEIIMIIEYLAKEDNHRMLYFCCADIDKLLDSNLIIYSRKGVYFNETLSKISVTMNKLKSCPFCEAKIEIILKEDKV